MLRFCTVRINSGIFLAHRGCLSSFSTVAGKDQKTPFSRSTYGAKWAHKELRMLRTMEFLDLGANLLLQQNMGPADAVRLWQRYAAAGRREVGGRDSHNEGMAARRKSGKRAWISGERRGSDGERRRRDEGARKRKKRDSQKSAKSESGGARAAG